MKFSPRPKPNMRNYLKIPPGGFVKGVFRGDPHTYRSHWGSTGSVLCAGDDCELCKDKKSSFRFRINFISREDGQLVSRVFEGGGKVYDQLEALHSEYNLEKTFIKISRQGSRKETTYTIMPLPEKFTQASENELSKVDLQDLGDGETVEREHEEVEEDAPF
jgi:hypothetical protein